MAVSDERLAQMEQDCVLRCKEFTPEGQLLREVRRQRRRIAELEERVEMGRTPCQCDPPGSGEEFCNGGCELRALLRRVEWSGWVSCFNSELPACLFCRRVKGTAGHAADCALGRLLANHSPAAAGESEAAR